MHRKLRHGDQHCPARAKHFSRPPALLLDRVQVTGVRGGGDDDRGNA
eukprot:COSAG06_NODE_50175_length_320_cov_1.009050_1_plen_46_part_10